MTKKLVSFGVDKVSIFQGTTHGGGALHGKPHKFCGAIYKTFIFNFEFGRFALTTMFMALNDTLNFKS